MIQVLFVDDESDILDIACLYLQKGSDISVTPAESAIQALELIQDGSFDVIVSDYEMPRMDGIAFLRQLRSQNDETPFIMYTGRSREKLVIDALNSGAFFLLQKGGISPTAQFLELRSVIEKAYGKKLAVERIRQSEERYRVLAESSHDAIFIIGPDGCLTYVNSFGARMLGRRVDDIVGKGLVEIFPPDISPHFLHNVREIFLTATPISHVSKVPFALRDRWLETWLTPILGEDGKVRAVMGASRDITSRMEMEEANKASELKFRAVLDQAADPILLIDPAGIVIDVNQRALTLTGIAREEFLGSPAQVFFKESDREAWEKHQKQLSTVVSMLSDIHLVNRKGDEIPVEVTSTSVVTARESFHQVVIRDVTERNRTLSLLRKQQQQLEATNRELEAFAYSVSHDLRAPVRVIEGYSSILLDKYSDAVPPEMRRIIERIMVATQKMQALIHDLLNLSRINKVEYRTEPVDLSALSRKIIDEIRMSDPSRVVCVEIDPDMTVHGDKSLLEVMLRNLLENAWKYTGQVPDPHIEVRKLMDPPKNPWYVVRDNGAGFDSLAAKDLFTPFKRFHTESEFSGTGIGLAIVQRIVNRHSGRVWAESSPGKGASFFFEL